MPITDNVVFETITILEDGQIHLRRSRVLLETDGVTEIHRVSRRQVLEPGQDVTAFPPRIRALCNFVWTPQVLAAWAAR